MGGLLRLLQRQSQGKVLQGKVGGYISARRSLQSTRTSTHDPKHGLLSTPGAYALLSRAGQRFQTISNGSGDPPDPLAITQLQLQPPGQPPTKTYFCGVPFSPGDRSVGTPLLVCRNGLPNPFSELVCRNRLPNPLAEGLRTPFPWSTCQDLERLGWILSANCHLGFGPATVGNSSALVKTA